MSIYDSLNRSGFAQLYFQAAEVRHNDLTGFFSRLDAIHHGNLTRVELQQAIDAADEIREYLVRAASYMHDNEVRTVETGP